MRSRDERREEFLATLARVFADPDENDGLGADAGNILLDFRVDSSRDTLMAFAAEAERIAFARFAESERIDSRFSAGCRTTSVPT